MAKSNRKATEAKHKTTETKYKASSGQARRRRPPPPEHPQHRKESSRKGDYEIGYGKPPVRNQFKPGQSGNPNGRPKRSKNSEPQLVDESNQIIEIRENGKLIRVSKWIAVNKALFAKAINGNIPAIRLVYDLRAKLPPDDQSSNNTEGKLSEEDQAILEEFFADFERNRNAEGGEDE